MLPKILLLLGYKDVFGQDRPKSPINLLKDIPKKNLLAELAHLNYQIKPIREFSDDNSPKTQGDFIRQYTFFDKKLGIHLADVLDEHLFQNKRVVIFNRPACIYAIEEILSADMIEDDDEFKFKAEDWDNYIRYLISVNSIITQVSESPDNVTFEDLNPKLLALNEVAIIDNFYSSLYRGWKMIQYLSASKFGTLLTEYIVERYNCDLSNYFKQVLQIFIVNSPADSKMAWVYNIHDHDVDFFNGLSIREKQNDPIKLLSIRKSPFYHSRDNQFYLLDSNITIQKCNDQLLNDFWFDKLKPLSGSEKFINIKNYRSHFGMFIESYLLELFRFMFGNAEHYKLYCFDELKVISGGSEIEIADFYVRFSKKILIGEVKSTKIYDQAKYAGDLDKLYNENREEFFKRVGVDQLVQHLFEMYDHMENLDEGFSKDDSYKVFPMIVISDTSFITPLMPEAINKRFNELIDRDKLPKYKISSVVISSIGDLELIEGTVCDTPKEIWNLLRIHASDDFCAPFSNTINRKDYKMNFPPKILECYKQFALKE